MTETEGVTYLHAGTKCSARLAVSLSSLRDYWDGPVMVFHYSEGGSEIPEFVRRICNQFRAKISTLGCESKRIYVKKVAAARQSPFRWTMFLDADTLVRAPLDQYFAWIRESGTVLTNFANWRTSGKIIGGRIRKWEGVYPELIEPAMNYGVAINTGTFGVTAGSEFLDHWMTVATLGDEVGIPLTDELAAQLIAPQHTHFLAPPEWGYSVRFGEQVSPPETAKIAHLHGNKHLTDNVVGGWWKQRAMRLLADPALTFQAWGDKRFEGWLQGPEPRQMEQSLPEKVVLGQPERWVDIVTTVVGRGTVGRAIDSLLSHFDFTGFRLRWLVHVDRCDVFSPDLQEATRQQLEKTADLFDWVEVVVADEWQGHGRSLLTLLRKVENDAILWEDDKLLTRPFSMRQLDALPSDFVSMQSRQSRIGATSPGFYRFGVLDYIRRHWTAELSSGDTEKHLMALLEDTSFVGEGVNLKIRDLGLVANAAAGVIRVRDGNLAEAKFEAQVSGPTVITACDGSYLDRLRRGWKAWTWDLNILSFPMILYYDPASTTPASFNFTEEHPDCRLIPWEFPIAGDNQRERMLSAFVFGPARDVLTPYWMKIDADVKTVGWTRDRNMRLYEESWKRYVMVGQAWGYTRVKGDPGQTRHWVNVLDDWWKGLVATEALDLDDAPMFNQQIGVAEKAKCPRLNSYVSMYQTEFTTKVAKFCGDRLPVPSQDTTMWYVAERMGKGWLGVQMKARGLRQ